LLLPQIGRHKGWPDYFWIADDSGVDAHINNNAAQLKQVFGWMLMESAASVQPPLKRRPR
jgi:hypothetical protein